MRPAVDAVLIVIDYLKAQSAVSALVGTRVATDLAPGPTYPAITVSQVDAGFRFARSAWTDEVTIDVDVWGNPDRGVDGEASASLTVRTARAALMAAPGYQHAQGVIVEVEDLSGPHWLPDDHDPPTPRFVFTVKVHAHP